MVGCRENRPFSEVEVVANKAELLLDKDGLPGGSFPSTTVQLGSEGILPTLLAWLEPEDTADEQVAGTPGT